MPFPDSETLKQVRDKLSDPNYEGGKLALPANATETERMKYNLCQLIAKYKRERNLLQKDLAEVLGIDEARMSDVLQGKIQDFTVDRLMGYANKLYPDLRIKIIAA